MLIPLTLSLISGCASSDPCKTVDAYLRALKAMDEDRLESFIEPSFRSRRSDGTDAPFDRARNRAYRDFERATKTRWTYSILGIDGDRVTALTTEDNEFYRALGVGVRTQVSVYAARNGRIYFAQNIITVDEHGRYLDAYRAFFRWLQTQPAAADLLRDGDLLFSSASGPKIVEWLKQYRRASSRQPSAAPESAARGSLDYPN